MGNWGDRYYSVTTNSGRDHNGPSDTAPRLGRSKGSRPSGTVSIASYF